MILIRASGFGRRVEPRRPLKILNIWYKGLITSYPLLGPIPLLRALARATTKVLGRSWQVESRFEGVLIPLFGGGQDVCGELVDHVESA